MFKTPVVIAIAAALAVASSAINRADAMPIGDPSGVRTSIDHLKIIDRAQYTWRGRQYCWYGNGWNGPGWYRCGHAWRRGYGWGGPYGWRGWGGPGPGPRWGGPGPGALPSWWPR
jgi:hypothetical protein